MTLNKQNKTTVTSPPWEKQTSKKKLNINKKIKKTVKFKRTSLGTKINKVEPGSKEMKNAHF